MRAVPGLAVLAALATALAAAPADARPERALDDPPPVELVLDEPPPPPSPPPVELVRHPPPPPPRPVELVVPTLAVTTPPPRPPRAPRARAFVLRYGVGGWTGPLKSFAVSLGVGGRLALAGRWEGIAGYEWLGVTHSTTTYPTMPLGGATGHRVHAGLRRPLIATTVLHAMTFALDVEAGVGGLVMTDMLRTGRQASLDAFAGLHGRAGMLATDPASPSRVLGLDFGVRVLARPEGTAAMFLIGFAWGS